MLQFILRRILFAIPTIFVISVMSFIIIQLPPGDFLTSYAAQLAEQGDSISERFSACLRDMFRQYEKVLVFFTDIPCMTPANVYELFSLLDLNHVVVSGKESASVLGLSQQISFSSFEVQDIQQVCASKNYSCAVIDPLPVVQGVADLVSLKSLERDNSPALYDCLHSSVFDLAGNIKSE